MRELESVAGGVRAMVSRQHRDAPREKGTGSTHRTRVISASPSARAWSTSLRSLSWRACMSCRSLAVSSVYLACKSSALASALRTRSSWSATVRRLLEYSRSRRSSSASRSLIKARL